MVVSIAFGYYFQLMIMCTLFPMRIRNFVVDGEEKFICFRSSCAYLFWKLDVASLVLISNNSCREESIRL